MRTNRGTPDRGWMKANSYTKIIQILI